MLLMVLPLAQLLDFDVLNDKLTTQGETALVDLGMTKSNAHKVVRVLKIEVAVDILTRHHLCR